MGRVRNVRKLREERGRSKREKSEWERERGKSVSKWYDTATRLPTST